MKLAIENRLPLASKKSTYKKVKSAIQNSCEARSDLLNFKASPVLSRRGSITT